MSDEIKKEYRCRDMYLAVALMAHGLKLIEIEKLSNDKRMIFVFKDQEDRKNIVQKYWTYEDNLPSKKVFESLRTIRDRLFSEKAL